MSGSSLGSELWARSAATAVVTAGAAIAGAAVPTIIAAKVTQDSTVSGNRVRRGRAAAGVRSEKQGLGVMPRSLSDDGCPPHPGTPPAHPYQPLTHHQGHL
ncbi:hypothetical protein Msi02_39200 [Microbispora siamensis]|uniref:Uncharacterized protein n=1 Tax=Microbispora siamensis TaxID=564413 RepID=A0ABQ4GNW0_9ACTN|nr:hypothetical protein Msi02_39200 [Microbispora siamensis]